MFIVLISRGYPSDKYIQNGNFEATQAQALAKMGHKVVVIGVNYYSIKHLDILGRHHKIDNNVEVYEDYSLAIPSHNLMPFKLMVHLISKKIDKILKHIISAYGVPDVIHSHYLLLTAATAKLIGKYNIPFICTEHWSKLNSTYLSKGLLSIGREAYSKSSRVIAVSKKTSESLNNKFNVESDIIYNMVDDDFFDESHYSSAVKDEFTFVSIGSMASNRKGFDILLKSFAKVIKLGHKGNLIIIGNGPKLLEYKKLAEGLGIADKVTFTGELDKHEVSSCITQSDVVVLASRVETFGVVLIEGMAKGKPVIATICGGPEDFITPDLGILVPSENEEALAQAMVKIQQDYSKYNSKIIRQNCYLKYSQESIAKQLLAAYQEIRGTE